MNDWDINNFEYDKIYRLSQLVRDAGMSLATLDLWRRKGSFLVYPGYKSPTNGNWFKYAIKGKSVPSSLLATLNW